MATFVYVDGHARELGVPAVDGPYPEVDMEALIERVRAESAAKFSRSGWNKANWKRYKKTKAAKSPEARASVADLTPGQERLLAAGHAVAARGEEVTLSAVAREAGLSVGRVCTAVRPLRQSDRWPWTVRRPGDGSGIRRRAADPVAPTKSSCDHPPAGA